MTNGGLDSEQQQFERFYKLSKFWITAKPILKKVGIVSFIVFDVLVVGWATYRFVDYGIFGFFSERAMIGSIVNDIGTLQNISSARAATPLGTKNADVFDLGENRADFYAEVSNPNSDWYASFTYRFVSSNGVTDFANGFILPGQVDKPVTVLAGSTTSTPRNVKLELQDVKWMRVNHHAIDDYEMWERERIDFDVSSVTFERQVYIEVREGEPAVQDGFGRTMFTIKNDTAYGYWGSSFTIRLLRSGKVVGVTATTITEFEPGQEREVVVNWFGEVPAANETQIEANIDIFDPDVYMPIRGEAAPDVRERIRISR